MEDKFRCDCPFTSAIDVLGDKWILVIIKLMLLHGKDSFKSLSESDEAIATNILSSKLKLLEAWGLISKTKLPDNKKANLYLLTEMGLSLTPILVELASWSDTQLRPIHPDLQDGEGLNMIRTDKVAFIKMVETNYREKLAKLSLAL